MHDVGIDPRSLVKRQIFWGVQAGSKEEENLTYLYNGLEKKKIGNIREMRNTKLLIAIKKKK